MYVESSSNSEENFLSSTPQSGRRFKSRGGATLAGFGGGGKGVKWRLHTAPSMLLVWFCEANKPFDACVRGSRE